MIDKVKRKGRDKHTSLHLLRACVSLRNHVENSHQKRSEQRTAALRNASATQYAQDIRHCQSMAHASDAPTPITSNHRVTKKLQKHLFSYDCAKPSNTPLYITIKHLFFFFLFFAVLYPPSPAFKICFSCNSIYAATWGCCIEQQVETEQKQRKSKNLTNVRF